jgi:hypothetical protein
MASHSRTVSIGDSIRSITDDEVEQYDEQGWVKLDGLLSPDLAGELLEQGKQLLGVSGDDAPHEQEFGRATGAAVHAAFYSNAARDNELFREVATSPGLGAAAARLIGAQPLRLWADSIICKPKSSAGEASGDSKWHNDWVMIPLDRAVAGSFWIVLDEVTPEMGSLQYLSGSHRERPLGRFQVVDYEAPRWLFEKYEVSPAFHLQPGDALAHDSLTFHGATENATERNRWAWTSVRFDARALYTGAANARADALKLPVNKPLEHEFFPVVYE